MSEIPKRVRVTAYFKNMQKKYGVEDISNRLRNQWDMQTVIEDIDNDKHMKQLIQFYFLFSEDRTFKDFFNKYNEYYESMLRVKADRVRRAALRKQTVEE